MAHAELAVNNTLGQTVLSRVQDSEEACCHEVKCDDASLASGIYFLALSSGSFVKTMKMLALRWPPH